MSNTTSALEAAVAAVIENLPKDGERQSARQRVYADRAFARVLKLIAPRIRHFIRQYGLSQHWDDAEQCCAIGVHRAIQAYDPERAQFTTFVNWQLRGELQSLRFRLMADQRPSARKVEATTVSLQALGAGPDGDSASWEDMIEDEDALDRTENAAAALLAERTRNALLDAYVEQLREVGLEQLRRRARTNRSVQTSDTSLPRFRIRSPIDPEALRDLEARLAQQRAIVERRLADDGVEPTLIEDAQERERLRQVAKRAAQVIAEIATSDPRFGGMFERRKAPHGRRVGDRPVDMLPNVNNTANRMTRVIAIDPDAVSEWADQNDMPQQLPNISRASARVH